MRCTRADKENQEEGTCIRTETQGSSGGSHLNLLYVHLPGRMQGEGMWQKRILDGRTHGETEAGRRELGYTEAIRGTEEHANGSVWPTLRVERTSTI